MRRIIYLLSLLLSLTIITHSVTEVHSQQELIQKQADKAVNEEAFIKEHNLDTIKTNLNEINNQIKELETNLLSGLYTNSTIPQEIIETKLTRLKELKDIYERQITSIEKQDVLIKAFQKVKEETNEYSSQGLMTKPPFKIDFFDTFYEENLREKTKTGYIQFINSRYTKQFK